ncbi:PhzF family phenazine biosynthesis protein [Paratractidigestivibacter sp.]|uniref:PhzF family phenazine biosynthesis protein n=1 Tax=Paratractidigestivibacter sp. TaxID=2847316 RepID=UPI002AC8EFBB|nr:PhzF family phenazine biosynthesis protein [Paratractidigestivibacter sp.]
MKQYIVDAFTSEAFAGNPASICVMDAWPTDAGMMRLTVENNLSETAFVVRESAGWHLRWFTPATEVTLCGHATLASAFVILNIVEPGAAEVRFNTLSGELAVTREDDLYRMDFPVDAAREIPVTDDMTAAFGARPARAFLGMDLLCVFDDEKTVREMAPDQALLAKLPGRIQNPTAPGAAGSGIDCVSRSFAPKLGVAEDPVCGSAHCLIADYWARELGRPDVHAYQASRRGGHLYCTALGAGRVAIRGAATLVATADVVAPLD